MLRRGLQSHQRPGFVLRGGGRMPRLRRVQPCIPLRYRRHPRNLQSGTFGGHNTDFSLSFPWSACGHRSSEAAHDNTLRQTMEEVKGISAGRTHLKFETAFSQTRGRVPGFSAPHLAKPYGPFRGRKGRRKLRCVSPGHFRGFPGTQRRATDDEPRAASPERRGGVHTTFSLSTPSGLG